MSLHTMPYPTEAEKRKAAMALNLCATSISRIIASNDMEVLDVEYNAILNNLNLQNMVKDEALLSTFKSILDTITFYRLQASDRRRAEARYRQQMNNAIWNATSQGAMFLFASAANPAPWAVVSGAIMAVGAFCNVKKAKADAAVEHDDEVWRLERSLVEQLHALRYSLFETSWRLSDRYGFDDAWRLTIPQIEQYNRLCVEPDPAWRYFALAQYRDCFEAYPHFWKELGESAFLAALAADGETAKRDFTAKAKDAFAKFTEIDMGLLREDMIGASALLRLAQIGYIETKSWSAALDSVESRIGVPLAARIKSLSCSAPDLLTQCAICYAAAYAETKRKELLGSAVSLMELVVCQKYNIPMSSRLLSKLYLMDGAEFGLRYDGLLAQVGEAGVISKDDAEGIALVRSDAECAAARLGDVLERQFRYALCTSNGGLFKCAESEVKGRLMKFLGEKGVQLDSSVVELLHAMWDDLRATLNGQFLSVSQNMGVPLDAVAKVAKDMDAKITECVNGYSSGWGDKISSKDRIIGQCRFVLKMVSMAREIFVKGLNKAVLDYYSVDTAEDSVEVKRHEDVETLANGVSAIYRAVVEAERRSGIFNNAGEQRHVDCFAYNSTADGTTKTWIEYTADPSWVRQMAKEHKDFCVTIDSALDIIPASQRIEADLEREHMKVRVYTKGNFIALANPYLAGAWVAHRLATINPDYEVVRYPKSIEARYMHSDRD